MSGPPSRKSFRRSVRRLVRAASLVAAVGGVLFVGSAAAVASVVRLKDGTTYEGDVKKQPQGGYLVTLAGGRKVLVAADQVAGFEAKPKAVAAADASLDRLASLRRAVENIPDLKQIVERYKQFIQQHPDSLGGEQAQADLVVWLDRMDRKLTKVGDQWLTDAERQAVAEQSFKTAEQAMALLAQGRPTEAAPLADQAIAENAHNPAGWYLKGLLLWKQDRAPEARKAFEQVVALAPDSAAGHNNLAVVLGRQNQQVAALLSYDRALLAAPQGLQVLDNLAEALHALPADLRNGTNVRKVVRHFNDQEALVRPQMEARGLARWGATWVPRADYDRLIAVEREIQAKIDRLEADYNALAARVGQLDRDIASMENTIRRMELDSYATDPVSGRSIRYPLPSSYYTFVRDLGTAKAERAQRATEQQQMRAQAKQLVQTIPTPRYAGVQRAIEADGTPVIGSKPALAGPADVPMAAAATAARPAAAGAGAPAAAAPQPATSPTAPPPPAPTAEAPAPQPPGVPEVDWPSRRPQVPPEKPSILDRRLSEPPPASGQPLLDDPGRK